MAEPKKKELLLESGTNELQILEFTISGRHFGINVAKVVEILQYEKVTPMPNANPFVEGVFRPRDVIMTVVNLAAYLGLPKSPNEERDIFINTRFNKVVTSFHVHTVEGMHRVSWEDIEKPDPAIYGGEEGMATGIARYDDRLATILDFEKILSDISPKSGIQMDEIERMGIRPTTNKPILIAEDSPLLERMIVQALEKSGYINVTVCTNGEEAWNQLLEYKKTGLPLQDEVTCVITDLEMPRMDGHRLLKLIREDSYLSKLPVIIFSSLISDEMKLKGVALGATAQISKPEIGKLVTLIDQHGL